MSDFDIIRDGYNTNDYNTEYRNRVLHEQEVQLLDKFMKDITDPKVVIDIGCGNGKLYDTYLVDNGADLTGIDLSERQVEEAQHNCPAGKFMVGNIVTDTLSVPDADGVVAFYSLFHIRIEDLPKVFTTIHSMLNDGGKLLFIVYTRKDGRKVDADWCNKPMVWYHAPAETYKSIAEFCGFDCAVIPCEYNEAYTWIYATRI